MDVFLHVVVCITSSVPFLFLCQNLLEQSSYHPGYLGYIVDDILPNYIGIVRSHYEDPYQPTRIS